MPSGALTALREAGRVAAGVREWGVRRVVAGARLSDVCAGVDEQVLLRGASLAFPTQCSVNEVAAHYCPSPEDPTVYRDGDLAKLDIGVHVDGWVVDTAATVNVGDRPEGRRAVAAARAALEAAIGQAGPGVEVRRLSEAIEAAIVAHGLKPLRNLCGHGVGRYLVHGPPVILNYSDPECKALLQPGMVVAIEPFTTEGLGLVAEQGEPEVFRLDPGAPAAVPTGCQAVLASLRGFRGLPFARRQLAGHPRERVEATLSALTQQGQLRAYAPLVDLAGRPVAQAEHTLWIGESGIEVLTR